MWIWKGEGNALTKTGEERKNYDGNANIILSILNMGEGLPKQRKQADRDDPLVLMNTHFFTLRFF